MNTHAALKNRAGPRVSLLMALTVGVSSVTFVGCETPGRTALLGAATGAAVGAHHGHALRGAAIGAGAGYVAGRVAQRARGDYYYND